MKIRNPYAGLEGYDCIGCSPRHPFGLKMEFELIDQTIISRWKPTDRFQGFPGVVHGGIQAALADEIAGWAIQVLLKTSGVTSDLEIKYLKPLLITGGTITLKAMIGETNGKFTKVNVEIFDQDYVLCTRSVITYYVFPEEIAREKYYYPGYESFISHSEDETTS